MIRIRQFRYAADNFSYLIFGEQHALAIDGGAVQEILSFATRKGLTLTHVTHTHGHADHTSGTRELAATSGARYLDQHEFSDNTDLRIEDQTVRVYRTPGHSLDSVVFHAEHYLISGDTLFNGTVGNCFTGDLKGFYGSLMRLAALADNTVVYAGHDYVNASLDYAKTVEPHNPDIEKFRRAYDPRHVFSTLGDERRINPFLRFNEESVILFLKKKGLNVETAYDRFKSIMSVG